MESIEPVASSNEIFDKCAKDLESNGGYALIPIPPLIEDGHGESKNVIPRAFVAARAALDAMWYFTAKRSSQNKSSKQTDQSWKNEERGCNGVPFIDPRSDSGSWTGYHNAAETNGRYNQFREGFVFSNGEMFDACTTRGEVDSGKKSHCSSIMSRDDASVYTQEFSTANFSGAMGDLFHLMHNVIANGVLGALERRLKLPVNYFQNELGPTNASSQWHLKRYAVDHSSSNVCDNNDSKKGVRSDGDVFLPVHTDPSLISVVILDREGISDGAMGLEVFSHSNSSKSCQNSGGVQPVMGAWKEIPQHGHDVAVIFVGSVLNYLTKSQVFSAVKHRVVDWDTNGHSTMHNRAIKEPRMAATLFVRPHSDAVMRTLPSSDIKSGVVQPKNPPSFGTWNARVSKNYMKKKQKGKI